MPTEGFLSEVWWLSFYDPELEREEDRALGVAIIGPAKTASEAVLLACEKGIRFSSGEVFDVQLPNLILARIPESYLGRLLSRDEAEELNHIMQTKEEGACKV